MITREAHLHDVLHLLLLCRVVGVLLCSSSGSGSAWTYRSCMIMVGTVSSTIFLDAAMGLPVSRRLDDCANKLVIFAQRVICSCTLECCVHVDELCRVQLYRGSCHDAHVKPSWLSAEQHSVAGKQHGDTVQTRMHETAKESMSCQRQVHPWASSNSIHTSQSEKDNTRAHLSRLSPDAETRETRSCIAWQQPRPAGRPAEAPRGVFVGIGVRS